jgi:hypothetical protein
MLKTCLFHKSKESSSTLLFSDLYPAIGSLELGLLEKPITTNPKVVGAIGRREFTYFWKDVLQAPQDVMNIIEEGYKIPFSTFPPPESWLPNNKSAREDPIFVCEQLYELERIGCISRSKKKPHIVMPLSSVFSNKKRLIVDGSQNLNPFVKARKGSLSHLEVANVSLTPGSYMMTCDLESGYYQIPIHKKHRFFFGNWLDERARQNSLFHLECFVSWPS